MYVVDINDNIIIGNRAIGQVSGVETGKIKFISNWLKIKNNNPIFDDLEQQILAEKSYMIKQ